MEKGLIPEKDPAPDETVMIVRGQAVKGPSRRLTKEFRVRLRSSEAKYSSMFMLRLTRSA